MSGEEYLRSVVEAVREEVMLEERVDGSLHHLWRPRSPIGRHVFASPAVALAWADGQERLLVRFEEILSIGLTEGGKDNPIACTAVGALSLAVENAADTAHAMFPDLPG